MFRHKITSCEDLSAIIGPRPRAKTVILCHGVFDIVHPGHLRHLAYAKQKAGILVASVTADAYVFKPGHHPYVPEVLRAQNLAALEMVDYVLVDRHSTPVQTIQVLQPDYFAKGYEYFVDGPSPETRVEEAALAVYGGEMVFTPGDIVYSSSALLEAQAPKLALEKLLSLMETEGIGFADIRKALHSLSGLTAHVVGDTIVDGYSECSLLGAAGKSPTFSVRLERTDRFTGGAGIVARHLKSAGATVFLSTVLGADDRGTFALRELDEAGVKCHLTIDRTRPTPYKERFIAAGQKMLQVDQVDNRPIPEPAVRALCDQLRASTADVVIMSDFRHGIFTRDSIGRLVVAIPIGRMKVADSQVSSRWGNILDFKNFDLITPNEREARFALGDQDTIVRPLGLHLFREAHCRNLILKVAERGLIAYRRGSDEPRDFFALDSFADQVVDPIGAGDALLAYASLVLASTQNLLMASILGAIGAAVACERQGNVPVSPVEVEEKISALERLARYG